MVQYARDEHTYNHAQDSHDLIFSNSKIMRVAMMLYTRAYWTMYFYEEN